MAIEIRPATSGEMSQLGMVAAYVYGGAFGDGADNVTSNTILPEWTLCAFDGPTMATSFATFPFTVRANGKAMSFGGVTAVGTAPEYRRQGIVRQIVTRALQEQKERGQSIVGLWASQAAIYQRYGYAAAGCNRKYMVDTADIQFYDGDPGACRVTRLATEEAMEPLKSLYRAFIANRFGYLHRSQALWLHNVLEERDDGPVHVAVARDGDQPRGYVVYTLRANKVAHAARSQELVIRDLVWLDLDAYRSLWHFVGQHDLVGRVRWDTAPMDDPATEIFIEPRMLHAQDMEGSWMRIVDVPTALSQRGYIGRGEINITISGDTLAPWNNNTWRLQVDDNEANASAVGSPPTNSLHAQMSIKALSSLFTGMHNPRRLHGWGLIQANEPAIAALQQMFAVHFAPHSPDHY